MSLPDHLGGHCNITHLDDGVLNFLIEYYQISSMLDIGCGPGGMVELAKSKGLGAKGIDGDFTINFANPEDFIVHDFTTGPIIVKDDYDLVWCCAFNEHVEEQYVSNFMCAIEKGKIVVMTYYELPGHNHVNCQPAEYWITVMNNYGFKYDQQLTDKIRSATTLGKRSNGKYSRKAWIRHYGLAFVKENKYWNQVYESTKFNNKK